MEEAIMAVYNAAFSVWNTFMGVAINMFTSSPSTISEGKLYALIKYIYIMVSDISLPIASVFFLLAIIKDVVGTPPEQQLRKFFGDTIKFCVIIGVLANLWDLMGGIMSIADGFTSQVAKVTGNTNMELSNSSLQSAINAVCSQEPQTQVGFLDVAGLLNWIKEYIVIQLQIIGILVASIITLVVIVSSSFSILSGAYGRILKPLIVMPFSSIAVAMAAGTQEAERIAYGYLKTFFAFCISGAYMVICVRVGSVLATTTIGNVAGNGTFGTAVMASIQCAITPVLIAGLIKGTDGVLNRFF